MRFLLSCSKPSRVSKGSLRSSHILRFPLVRCSGSIMMHVRRLSRQLPLSCVWRCMKRPVFVVISPLELNETRSGNELH